MTCIRVWCYDVTRNEVAAVYASPRKLVWIVCHLNLFWGGGGSACSDLFVTWVVGCVTFWATQGDKHLVPALNTISETFLWVWFQIPLFRFDASLHALSTNSYIEDTRQFEAVSVSHRQGTEFITMELVWVDTQSLLACFYTDVSQWWQLHGAWAKREILWIARLNYLLKCSCVKACPEPSDVPRTTKN